MRPHGVAKCNLKYWSAHPDLIVAHSPHSGVLLLKTCLLASDSCQACVAPPGGPLESRPRVCWGWVCKACPLIYVDKPCLKDKPRIVCHLAPSCCAGPVRAAMGRWELWPQLLWRPWQC